MKKSMKLKYMKLLGIYNYYIGPKYVVSIGSITWLSPASSLLSRYSLIYTVFTFIPRNIVEMVSLETFWLWCLRSIVVVHKC